MNLHRLTLKNLEDLVRFFALTKEESKVLLYQNEIGRRLALFVDYESLKKSEICKVLEFKKTKKVLQFKRGLK